MEWLNFARMDSWSFWSNNMPKRDLRQMIEDMDYPQDVAGYVSNEIAKNGNEGRILSGELVLPSRQDAIHAFDRINQRFGLNDDQKALHKRVEELEQQLREKGEAPKSWDSQRSSTQQAPRQPEQPIPTSPQPPTPIFP